MKYNKSDIVYFQHIMFLLLNDNMHDNKVFLDQVDLMIDLSYQHDLVLEVFPEEKVIDLYK